MAISEPNHDIISAFSFSPYADLILQTPQLNYILRARTGACPARLFWFRDNPLIVVTLHCFGIMAGLPGCLDQLSTHAAIFYTVGRAIACSHFLHRPLRASPIERRVAYPNTPDSASNFRRVTFTMPAIVRLPTACVFVSPL